MARRFTKVSEEEIKTAFFYPSDLVNTKTLRLGIYPPLFTSPSGDSCILSWFLLNYFSDITSGKLKFILDILWLIILHFEIHSASE